MFCYKCGASVPDDAVVCGACGAQLKKADPVVPSPSASYYGGAVIPPRIENHLVGAIISTLCCCLPFGIVSIVYAAQVNGKAAMGDIVGAQQAADKAKMWMWIAVGVGLISNILSMILQFAVAAAQAAAESGSY